MKKRELKQEKAITLIALVVTIVVLIILATISINAVMGENGIIKKAELASQMQANAVASDEDALAKLEQEYANAVADLEGPEVIDTAESKVGYYADIDGDTNPDGVIYADLAVGVSGQWSNSDGVFSYEAITGTKDYYISKTNYEGPFGTKDVLTATGSGKDRFYVMALEDFNAGTYYCWYDAAYDSGISDYATVTSTDFGTGKTNTETMIEKWNSSAYGTQNDNGTYADMWGAIQDEVESGWFVPSKEEWSAFGYNLGITSSNRGNYGLSAYCWLSSLYDPNLAWRACFGNGFMFYLNLCNSGCVRLSATF